MNHGISSNVVRALPANWRPGHDSLLDLLRLANLAPTHSVLGIRKVESNGGVHLAFKTSRGREIVSPIMANYREELFSWALGQLMRNTIREVKSVVPNAPLNHVPAYLERMLKRKLGAPEPDFSPEVVRDMLADLGRRISESTMFVLGSSKLARDAPRTATDCMIDWIAALSRSQTPFAQFSLKKAQFLWEQAEVSKGRLRRVLEDALADRASDGHPALRRKAQSLLAQGALQRIPEQVTGRFSVNRVQHDDGCPISAENVPYTQLHDNLYGRIFDSTLIAYLVQYPSPAVLQVTHDIAIYLSKCLGKMASWDAVDVVREVCDDLHQDRRFWGPFKGELVRLQAETRAPERMRKLQALLRKPLRDGGDILVRQSICVKLMVAMRDVSVKSVPWMVEADKNYLAVVLPQRKRLCNEDTLIALTPPTAGITFSYQPATLTQRWMIPSGRPTEWFKPDFDNPSIPIKVALEAGLPYVSGLSGSANLMLHLGSYLKQTGEQELDSRQLLMSVLMFVVFDGGHSIHEVLWMGHQLDEVLQLGLGFEKGGDPLHFVGSMAQLERMFAGTPLAQDLAKAKAMAWQKTLEAFERHSFYADS